MVDYIRSIGSGDEMMIRDTGGWVEFWFHSDQYTWNNQQDWSYWANGQHVPGVFRLNTGGGWHHLGSVYVSTRQDIRFTMVDEGLGWPTYDFWQFIERATVPPPPTMNGATATSSSSIYVQFTSTGDGGMPVREWQLAYGTDPYTATNFISSPGTSEITGLSSGVTYYFWARGRNDIGWGNWSSRAQAIPFRIPDSPSPVVLSNVTQTSVHTNYRYDERWNGGTPVREWQIGYGTDPNTPQSFIDGVTLDIAGLDPGKTYYFWSRARNDIGWSAWSPRSQVTLVAGARVLVGTTWKRAVPYVNVNGVWKLARPWARAGGVWKETL